MKEKKLWAVSLTILGLTLILYGAFRLLWAGVPDAVVRTLGIVLLIALPVFAFATVRLVKAKNK